MRDNAPISKVKEPGTNSKIWLGAVGKMSTCNFSGNFETQVKYQLVIFSLIELLIQDEKPKTMFLQCWVGRSEVYNPQNLVYTAVKDSFLP